MNYKFRKKPVVIEAFQMTEERRENNRDWPEWLNEAWNKDRRDTSSLYQWVSPAVAEQAGMIERRLAIRTLEGEHVVSWGDWIIRGVQGELYPCKPDIFELTYDLYTPEIDAMDHDLITPEEALAERENEPATDDGHNCQFCNTALDATVMTGVYECPNCLANFPDTVTVKELHDWYYELIMQVSHKYEGESRHETARRYIIERENMSYPIDSKVPQMTAQAVEQRMESDASAK